jgi:LacI family transcriptional regulator
MGRVAGAEDVSAPEPQESGVHAVTLADLAREAGTSPSTASRALSGRGYVSAPARKRLLAAADRLGYVPNASARTLKQKTSRVVGVVVSDLGNPFYGGLAAGVEQTLREADYQMMLVGDNSQSGEEMTAVRTFLAMRAPGVILTPVGQEATSFLLRRGIAVVEVDRRMANVPCDAVVIDNVRGARVAVDHLLGLGHRRIAFLGVDTEWTSDAGRLEGYRLALAAAGVPADDELVLRLGFHEASAEERIGALLDRTRPTAVFAANNLLAEQAWRVLRARGLVLPRDISLVGFDDVQWTEMVSPGITVVAQPTIELGRRAAALLLRRMDEPDSTPTAELLQPSLVVRGSTAAPAA